MKSLHGFYYVEVKDESCFIHPNENIVIGERDPPTPLRTHISSSK